MPAEVTRNYPSTTVDLEPTSRRAQIIKGIAVGLGGLVVGITGGLVGAAVFGGMAIAEVHAGDVIHAGAHVVEGAGCLFAGAFLAGLAIWEGFKIATDPFI